MTSRRASSTCGRSDPTPLLTIPADDLTTRWSPTACARPRWSAAASSGAIAPRVSSFHPLRNAAASETRYNADPQRPDRRRRRAPRARGARSWRSTTRTRAGRPSPARPTSRENHYGPVPRIIVSLLGEPPEVRVWRLDPDSYEELPWRIVEPTRRVEPAARAAKLPLSSSSGRDRVIRASVDRHDSREVTESPCNAP